MFSAFSKAFSQLSDPPVQRVLLICLAGTIVIYGVLFTLIGWVLTSTTLLAWPGAELWADWLLGLGAGLLALMLFPGVMSAALGLMLEPVVDAVEARHYPDLPPPHSVDFMVATKSAVRLLALTVVLNLLALPFYILLTFLGAVLFYAINGYLIGREYYELVALRRADADSVEIEKRDNRTGIIWAGAVTTFLLTIPVINIIAPVIGVAAMTHLRRRWEG